MQHSNLTAIAITLVLMSGGISTATAKSISLGSTSLVCSTNADCKKKCEDKGHTWKPNPGGSTHGTCTAKKSSFGQRQLMSPAPFKGHQVSKSKVKVLKPLQKPKVLMRPRANLIPSVIVKTPTDRLQPMVKPMIKDIKAQPRLQAVFPNRILTPLSLKQKQSLKAEPTLLKSRVTTNNQTSLTPFKKLKAETVQIKKVPSRKTIGLTGGFAPQTQNVAKGASGLKGAEFATAPPMSGFIEKELIIPLQVLADKVQAVFQGTKIRLNNYGPRHGNSWYKGNDSYVELPPQFGIAKNQFSFPAMNALPVRYYINNVNLASIHVNENVGKLKVDFNFESSGKEIKGHCSNSIKCILGNDLSVPDIQMNNAKASIQLTPALYKGSVSFSQVTVGFTANIQAQGGCDVVVLSSICNLVDYKNIIKNNAKSAIKNMVDQPKVRDLIAQEMYVLLANQNVNNIQSVDVFGRMLVIKYRQMFGQMAQ